eukprot:7267525-Pyramimonas_sp.AAC.1
MEGSPAARRGRSPQTPPCGAPTPPAPTATRSGVPAASSAAAAPPPATARQQHSETKRNRGRQSHAQQALVREWSSLDCTVTVPAAATRRHEVHRHRHRHRHEVRVPHCYCSGTAL